MDRRRVSYGEHLCIIRFGEIISFSYIWFRFFFHNVSKIVDKIKATILPLFPLLPKVTGTELGVLSFPFMFSLHALTSKPLRVIHSASKHLFY